MAQYQRNNNVHYEYKSLIIFLISYIILSDFCTKINKLVQMLCIVYHYNLSVIISIIAYIFVELSIESKPNL